MLIVLLIGVAVSLMLLLEIVDETSSFGAGELLDSSPQVDAVSEVV